MNIIDFAIGRARTFITLLILILIAGFSAYNAIPKESSPDIDIPIIYVSMALEGISPEDSERLLIRPMEQELMSIEGVKEMRSTAYTGGGFVLLEFQVGFDKDRALFDVQTAVDRGKSELPDSMDKDPSVSEVNFSLFPVLVVSISGDAPERTMVKAARELKDRIEALSEVLEVNISGDREELVEIILDPVKLESYGIRGEEVLNFFARSNQLVAAGNLDTGAGRFAIKVPGLFETVEDILTMPIRVSGDSAITVQDIASIRKTYKDAQSFARINGKPAVALNIVKRTGENIIDTVDAVSAVVETEEKYWPETLKANLLLDRSDDIKERLVDLQNNMISAILLVMIVLIAALGINAATFVGIAIPGAFLSGVLVLYMMGLTVNIVVLFALILSVGMLVDGAIVVTEFADRKMVEGLNRKEAYALAAKRMAKPIIASTATTLAAFAPLLFWPDVVGEFMKYMPITLLAVLTSSLFMALIFVPVLGAYFGKPGAAADPDNLHALAVAEQGDITELKGITGRYVRFLSAVLKRPGLVLLTAIILLIGVQLTYKNFGKGIEFFPDIEPEIGTVLIHARGNISIYEQYELIRQVEERVIALDDIETFYTKIGKEDQGNDEFAEDVIGQIQMEFKPWNQRRPAEQVFSQILKDTEDLAGILIEARKEEEGPPSGKDVQIEISSRFPEKIDPIVEKVYDAFNEIGDFIAIEDSRPLPAIEWELSVDRAQAAKFGVDIALIGQYVRMITNGLIVAEYRPNETDEEVDVVVRHPKSYRTIDQLNNIRIETDLGSIPITNFIKREAKPATGTIDRVDRRRVITVKADLPPGFNTNAKIETLKAWFLEQKESLDPDVNVRFRGEDEDQREAAAFLQTAFMVALAVMAMILLTQFNSFYQAFLILSAVIMSTIGVMIGLLVTGQPFGIVMSGVGVIALAGIIVNNNIVLIDTYDHLRKDEGLEPLDAVIRTAAQRLRPVMLTTITTVLGLMPMVLQMNIDFIARDISIGAPSTQWWVQLSTAIVFGLSFSTVLTLVVTPAALYFPHKIKPRFVKIFNGLKHRLAVHVKRH